MHSLGNDPAGTPLFGSTNPVRPGYTLVKEGGSIYGNGNTLQFAYVAAEKTFAASTQYGLIAFPFRHAFANATTVTTGDNTVTLTERTGTKGYTYDGAERAAWNSTFSSTSSEHWHELTDNLSTANTDERTVAAADGYLLEFTTQPVAEELLRFTGWAIYDGGGNVTSYAYNEDNTMAMRMVPLTQYNNIDGTDGHYTRAEDMGWNLKGLPWLVSNYATGGTNPDFNMTVPHVLYTIDGTGNYSTVQSWAAGTLSPGDGFLTQTAVHLTADEPLGFKRLTYGSTTVAPVKEMLTLSFSDDSGWADVVSVGAADDAGTRAATAMDYTINVDGIKWLSPNEDIPQIWLENTAGTSFSLAAHAPVETPIPVGLRVAREGTYTFSLQQASTLYAAPVWLIDAEAGTANDLTSSEYSVALNNDAPQRFYLHLGGTQPLMQNAPESGYKVYVRDRVLHVLGTHVGDRIAVYATDGALVVTDSATDDHWRVSLPNKGIYAVRVEQSSYKVMAK